jgi:NADPH:quinone reductase-like Zn-dependent oxidoreductase
MQAVLYRRYGPPEVLEYSETNKPVAVAHEVLVRVCAASVNPYDWHFLRGTPSFIRVLTGIGKPKSNRLGADLAGVVESVGPEVTRFKPGDAVFGTGRGAFAQYACAKETELALKPETISFEQAAAVPIAGITALQALRDRGNLQPGQAVLINGAAGGVGTFAVQIAAALGASVTGVCSTRNVELVHSLGAVRVIDYTRDDFALQAERYDVIFDLIGNRSLAEFRRALKPKGVFIGCGGGGPDTSSAALLAGMLGRALLAPFASQRLTGVLARINTGDLNVLGELMSAGKVKPSIDRSYPLAETADAIRYVETCHAHGKVIIAVP